MLIWPLSSPGEIHRVGRSRKQVNWLAMTYERTNLFGFKKVLPQPLSIIHLKNFLLYSYFSYEKENPPKVEKQEQAASLPGLRLNLKSYL